MNSESPAAAARAKLETELRALMRDPNYWTSRLIQERARAACERLYGAARPAPAMAEGARL